MQQSAKYIIHAEVRTSGVVERSDVVGAVFGQTEGLLGDGLDLRDLQDASKVGRIDVNLDTADGRSFGTITITSGLDRVETAVLAASLETIDQVGPCRAECTVSDIADARAAKRRDVVERATELLSEFEESAITGDTLLEAVRKRARVEAMGAYEGVPAGPRVEDSDAVIVVEGRADVRQLLEYGIKNAVAVEGTDVPDQVATLTHSRTTTAFLDGDRGGDLILRELQQRGDVDYVAFAPAGQSVEDLERQAVRTALQKKLPAEQIGEGVSPREAYAPTDGGADKSQTARADETDTRAQHGDAADAQNGEATGISVDGDPSTAVAGEAVTVSTTDSGTEESAEAGAAVPAEGHSIPSGATETPPPDTDTSASEAATATDTGTSAPGATTAPDETQVEADARTDADEPSGELPDQAETGVTGTTALSQEPAATAPQTLGDHVDAIVTEGSGRARLLSEDADRLEEVEMGAVVDTIDETDQPPHAVVLDGPVTQAILDIAAQRDVRQVVGTETGEFVKQPASVSVYTASQF